MLVSSHSGDHYEWSAQECKVSRDREVLISCICPAWGNPYLYTTIMRELIERS